MRKCFSMLLGAGIIALLTSCNFAAIPNDGTRAKDGLNHYVDWSNGDGGDSSGGGGGTSGENSIFTNCMVWESMGQVGVDFSDSAITCWNEGNEGWFGIAFGQINDEYKYSAYTDMSKVKYVDFTASSIATGSYTIKICNQEVSQKYTVTSSPVTNRLTVDDPSKYAEIDEVFVVVGEGGNNFNSESNALKITDIKFLDENEEQLTTLPTKAK